MAELQSTNVTGTLCVNGVAIGGGGKDFKICCVTASTTWTPPSDLVTGDGMVQAYVIGAGGGGGGATKQGSKSPKPGGGGAGFVLDTLYQVTSSNDACTVTIGAGGTAGAGVTSGAGGDGGDGGDSCVFEMLACGGGGGAGTPDAGYCIRNGRLHGHAGGAIGCSTCFCAGSPGQPGGSAGGYAVYRDLSLPLENNGPSGLASDVSKCYVSAFNGTTIGNYGMACVRRSNNDGFFRNSGCGVKIGKGVRLFGKIYATGGPGGCGCGTNTTIQHDMPGRLRGGSICTCGEEAICCGDGGGGGGLYYSFGYAAPGGAGADGLVILTWNE